MEHPWFDTAIGLVILVNSGLIGYETSVTLEGGEGEVRAGGSSAWMRCS